MTAMKKKPHKPHHKPAKARTVKPRRHRLHVPPGGAFNGSPTSMSQAMVDRLFWRAGFGPSAGDRATWTGKPLDDAVDFLLNTPQGALVGGDPTRDGKPLDPTGDDTDLVLSWVDRMVRTSNPLVERMTFFWHRHWANSRASVSPTQLLITQNTLLRKYGDLATNPGRHLPRHGARHVQGPVDAALPERRVQRQGPPNENYGREFVELFTLGVNHVITGAKNYSENDVAQLAKSFTGWYIDDANPDDVKVVFDSGRMVRTGRSRSSASSATTTPTASSTWCSAHDATPRTSSRSCGASSCPRRRRPRRCRSCRPTTSLRGVRSSRSCAPILTDPQLFESIDEPNMIKPPVVFVSGALRAIGLGVSSSGPADYLDSMGQLPYFPPTVAGWEGGLSWLNTNTALARFGFIGDVIGHAPTGSPAKVVDVPGETPQAAFDRAFGAVGAPWMSAGTRAAIQDYAGRAPVKSSNDRIARQVMLRTLMLAGPDAQVM